MNIETFVAGYRLGHDGHPPALTELALDHEMDDVESAKPPPDADTDDHDWAWHLLGWTVGQAIAAYQIGQR